MAEQQVQQPRQQVQPPHPPRAPAVNPLFVRATPLFKTGTDLDVYLQRFRAYSRAAAVPEREQCDLLISLLDDRTLNGLSTLVNQGEYNMADLVTALRRAEGYNNNRERFITELRARKRLRNEDIWSYHLALANLAKKAYPDNTEMQAGSLRESFIANLNEPYHPPESP